MVSRSGSREKSGSNRSGDTGDKDRLIAELKDRVAVLEKELRSKHDPASQDTAERKRAEEAVRAADVRFRSLIQNSSDVIRILDKEGHIIYESPSSDKILGYPPDYTLGRSPFEFIHPDDRERVRKDLDEVLDGRNPGTPTEFRIRKSDGSYLEVESIGKNMIGVPGVDGIVITTRPITERKRAEEALRKSEANLERAQRITALGNWEWDLKTNRLSGSREYHRLFGHEPRESVPFEEFCGMVHPDDRDWVNNAAKNGHYDGLPNGYEFRIVLPDGSQKYIHTVVEVIVDENGHPVRIFGTMQDITERKRVEKALIKDSYILTKSQEVAHVGNWAWDLETGEFTGSAENYRIWGFEPGEVRATREWVLSRVLPEDRTALADFMEVSARDGKQGSIDFRVMQPDGSVRYVNTIVDKAVRSKTGRITRLYGISQDVTERKQAEEALREAKAQAELYVDLMGHDINNMNQVSLGFLELAHGIIEMNGRLGEDNIVLLEKAMDSLKDSSRLIDSVRKIQREKMGLYEPQVLDVGTVIEDAVEHFDLIPGRDVRIVYDQYKHYLVKANGLLKDVFINLVGNAIKHSRGSLVVNIRMSPVVDNGKKYCRVEVEDNGPGIPDTLKSTLFDRLNLTTTRAKGKGFGLCLIKMLVDDYRGRFWVEDRVPGDHTKGARFVVMLPAVEK